MMGVMGAKQAHSSFLFFGCALFCFLAFYAAQALTR